MRDGRMVYALEDGENRFYAGFAPGRNCLKGEAEANAQLAMAAPDLLEALQLFLDAQILPEYHQGLARAAISKALGDE